MMSIQNLAFVADHLPTILDILPQITEYQYEFVASKILSATIQHHTPNNGVVCFCLYNILFLWKYSFSFLVYLFFMILQYQKMHQVCSQIITVTFYIKLTLILLFSYNGVFLPFQVFSIYALIFFILTYLLPQDYVSVFFCISNAYKNNIIKLYTT